MHALTATLGLALLSQCHINNLGTLRKSNEACYRKHFTNSINNHKTKLYDHTAQCLRGAAVGV